MAATVTRLAIASLTFCANLQRNAIPVNRYAFVSFMAKDCIHRRDGENYAACFKSGWRKARVFWRSAPRSHMTAGRVRCMCCCVRHPEAISCG